MKPKSYGSSRAQASHSLSDYQLFGHEHSTPPQLQPEGETDAERTEESLNVTPESEHTEADLTGQDIGLGEPSPTPQLGLGLDLADDEPYATAAQTDDVRPQQTGAGEPPSAPPAASERQLDPQAVWHAVLDELELLLPTNEFQTWVRDSWALAYEDGELIVAVPSPYTSDWLNCRLRDRIQWTLRHITKRTIAVKFRVQPPPAQKKDDVSDTPLYAAAAPATDLRHFDLDEFVGQQFERRRADTVAKETQEAASAAPPAPSTGSTVRIANQLNAHHTFESFVVGNNNRMAEAAAMAVSDTPGQRFNPLFIYGGVGLGKTHLLHAIGNRAQQRGRHVLYCSSETFTNDLIGAIRAHKTDEFRNKYRQVDILLIDDIQFIGGKESTQEEFFHTFNELHANGRQIVLTSDRPPKALATLEERLRSRFEGGVQTDISRPDFETRVAILQSKAHKLGLQTSQDVLSLIAERIDSNVRELEGALNQFVLQLDLHNRSLTYTEAAAMLETITPNRTPCPPARVVEIVAAYFDLTVEDLVGTRRTKAIAWPRQIAMYLLREENQLSLPAIGTYLGDRDHTTVRYGVERISEQLVRDDELRQNVIALREKIYLPFIR